MFRWFWAIFSLGAPNNTEKKMLCELIIELGYISFEARMAF